MDKKKNMEQVESPALIDERVRTDGNGGDALVFNSAIELSLQV